MTCPRASCVLLVSLLALAAAAAAQAGTPRPLFAADTVLDLRLELDFSDFCDDPESDDCDPVAGVLRYTQDDGAERRLDVLLHTRGRWRRGTGNCAVPALFVEFDPAQTADTLFAGRAVVPFTSHCQHFARDYQGYALLEYLAYRYYNLLTPASVRARLARIEYRDAGARLNYTRYGFFSEHFLDVAERIGAEWLDADAIDPLLTDPMELATLSLFQYMIGHLDWSAVRLHNVTAFRRPDGGVVAVPFDFDYAGLVDAEYAAPPRELGVRDVRTRQYRGFCRPGIDWDRLFAIFLDRQEEMFGLLREQEGLRAREQRRAEWYLQGFFHTIASPDRRAERIVAECRPPGR